MSAYDQIAHSEQRDYSNLFGIFMNTIMCEPTNDNQEEAND